MMNKKIMWAALALLVVALGWYMWQPKAPATEEMGTNEEEMSNELPGSETGTAPATTAKTPTKTTATTATKGIKVVTYTNAGFTPFISEIKVGEAVRFVNNSSKAMWITGYQDPGGSTDALYSELDQGKSIGKGQSYTFNFLKKGVWGYKNKNAETDRGAVVVQ